MDKTPKWFDSDNSEDWYDETDFSGNTDEPDNKDYSVETDEYSPFHALPTI